MNNRATKEDEPDRMLPSNEDQRAQITSVHNHNRLRFGATSSPLGLWYSFLQSAHRLFMSRGGKIPIDDIPSCTYRRR